MIRGIYTSAIGMAIQQQRIDVISNNLSNASTNGFNRDIIITQSFNDSLAIRIRDFERSLSPIIGPMSLGIFTNTVHRDFSQGAISRTDSPLDLAINDFGFFVVNIEIDGEIQNMFTRNGNFSISSDRFLTTLDGNRILDIDANEIEIPEGIISINQNGEIFVADEFIATLWIANFENLETLRPFGLNLYLATEETIEAPFIGNIMQGNIELSNVNSIKEMIEIIAISRTFEANQQMIRIQDQSLSQAVNEIGRR
jgi:flagellar basal-body rod protein FlgG